MSLTPLDESDKQAQSSESADSDGKSNSLLARILGRARSLVGRVVTAFGRLQLSDSPIEQRNRQLERTAGRKQRTTKPVTRTQSETESGGIAWSSADRTSSVEPDEADGPEIVATWDNTGLTLSEKGDDDAQISSDTWAEVER